MTKREALIVSTVQAAIESANVSIVALEPLRLADTNISYGVVALRQAVKRFERYLNLRGQEPQYPGATFGPTT